MFKLFISLHFSLLWCRVSINLLPLIVGVPLAFKSILFEVLKLALFWEKLFTLRLHVSLAFSHSIIFNVSVLLFSHYFGLLVLLLLLLPLLFVVDALEYGES
jgi:hypothetical protein